eukprot:5526792-Heterocapsa_arctica.AAC.1
MPMIVFAARRRAGSGVRKNMPMIVFAARRRACCDGLDEHADDGLCGQAAGRLRWPGRTCR